MRRAPCDRLWEIDALRDGLLSRREVDSNRRHRAACAECRVQFDEDERLTALGRDSHVPAIDAVRVQRVRLQILRRAASPRAERRLRWLVPGFGAAAVLLLAAWPRARTGPGSSAVATVAAPPAQIAPASQLAAQVEALDDARWTQRRDGGIERVGLDSGTIKVDVRHQDSGERCFVGLPDGEIEVRGTAFTVSVRDGRTRAVTVESGVVALRVRGASEQLLRAGQRWLAEDDQGADPVHASSAVREQPAQSVRRSSVAPGSPVVPSSSAQSPARPPSGEDDYVRAVSLYESRSFAEAAAAFHEFAEAHPESPEADDAQFLEAASLARAGRPDAAAALAERFLESHANGFHARDAAILVARAARDRGDCAKARAAVAPWATAPTADVAAALGACGLPSR